MCAYNSADGLTGGFLGHGWTHNYNAARRFYTGELANSRDTILKLHIPEQATLLGVPPRAPVYAALSMGGDTRLRPARLAA